MPKLVLIRKGEVITQFNLPEGGIGIGRSVVNEIQLKSPSVSERHARIFTTDSGSTIKDLSSALGTFVNDRAISRCDLRNNDVILIGSYKLQYQQDGTDQRVGHTPAVTAPVPEQHAAQPAAAEPISQSESASGVDSGHAEVFAPSAQLLVLNGINQGALVHLTHDRLVLGKNHRRSLVIELVGQEYMVSSLANASEVALNGAPLGEPTVLCENDQLRVEDVKLRFVSDSSSVTN
jgi:hypothetical protein